jgi:hypothetical protein
MAVLKVIGDGKMSIKFFGFEKTLVEARILLRKTRAVIGTGGWGEKDIMGSVVELFPDDWATILKSNVTRFKKVVIKWKFNQ